MPHPEPKRTNLYGLDAGEIRSLPALAGEPAYRASQIAHWIYGRGVDSFEEMTDLSKAVRQRLLETCEIRRARPVENSTAGDASATKVLFLLDDGRTVEAVWIRDPRRETLCISSQAGCAYGCTFCATATMKAGRNLTTGEIVGQVAELRARMVANGKPDVHNIVFMGMGEPLANYDAVVGALRLLCGEPGMNLAARRITVSTVGLEPEIRRLAREPVGVRLAFSLNATTDELRSEIMPVNRKYPFRAVLEALREYQQRKGSRVTLEYVLLNGINDTPEDARRLAGFAAGLSCKVNLIAFNPHPYAPYSPTPDPGIEKFRAQMLPRARHVTITVRWSKGRDIQAACGQLATLHREPARQPTPSGPA